MSIRLSKQSVFDIIADTKARRNAERELDRQLNEEREQRRREELIEQTDKALREASNRWAQDYVEEFEQRETRLEQQNRIIEEHNRRIRREDHWEILQNIEPGQMLHYGTHSMSMPVVSSYSESSTSEVQSIEIGRRSSGHYQIRVVQSLPEEAIANDVVAWNKKLFVYDGLSWIPVFKEEKKPEQEPSRKIILEAEDVVKCDS